MRLSRKFFVAVLGWALVLFACSGGGGDDSGSDDGDTVIAADGGSGQDDDELEVADAVPMALINQEFLASVETSSGQVAGTSSSDAGEDAEDSSASNPAADGYSHALRVINAAPAAAGNMNSIATDIKTIINAVFGEAGYFRGKSVLVQKASGHKLFYNLRSDGKNDYIDVRLNPDGSLYKYRVDIYQPDGDQWLLKTMFEFSPNDGGSTGASVHLQRIADSGSGTQQFIEAWYDTDDHSMGLVFGDVPAPIDNPVKTVLSTVISDDGGLVQLGGAYRWPTRTVSSAYLYPDYYMPYGAIELFRARFMTSGAMSTVQEVAMIPAASIGSAPWQAGPDVFDAYGYPPMMLAFLRMLLRDSTLTSNACSTAGSQIRTAWGATEQPDVVADAPDNLCTGSSASDTEVEQIIDATCNAGINLALSIDETGTGAPPVTYSLCDRQLETHILGNPIFLHTVNGTREIVLPPDQPTAEHVSLQQALDASDFMPDVSLLESLDWQEPVVKSEAELSGAAPRPE